MLEKKVQLVILKKLYIRRVLNSIFTKILNFSKILKLNSIQLFQDDAGIQTLYYEEAYIKIHIDVSRKTIRIFKKNENLELKKS